jgi:hypothetical protein
LREAVLSGAKLSKLALGVWTLRNADDLTALTGARPTVHALHNAPASGGDAQFHTFESVEYLRRIAVMT